MTYNDFPVNVFFGGASFVDHLCYLFYVFAMFSCFFLSYLFSVNYILLTSIQLQVYNSMINKEKINRI